MQASTFGDRQLADVDRELRRESEATIPVAAPQSADWPIAGVTTSERTLTMRNLFMAGTAAIALLAAPVAGIAQQNDPVLKRPQQSTLR